jgi:YaaC-like Protein
MVAVVRLDGRDLKLHKATVGPSLGAKTVLTNSPWEFVSLWLQRESQDDALFYWNQAREFHRASSSVAIQSAPLLHYYSFMNATKALLTAKGIAFNEYHGVKAHNIRGASKIITVSNEGVKIQNNGILPALAAYMGDTEASNVHSLQEMFFNLVCIHRTYCLTYKSQAEMFLPLVDCAYVFDRAAKQVYFKANLSKDFADRKFIRRLPPSLVQDCASPDTRAIRSVATTPAARGTIRRGAELTGLQNLHMQLRADVHYINGNRTLWYAKGVVLGPARLKRAPLVLMLGAMHRLSEICRYNPIELAAFLSGQKNWLLSEFIQMVPNQFIDEIASEITGYQFMTPNTRAPE